MIDKTTLHILNQFKKLILETTSPNAKLILFGSFATNRNTEASDIDIAVILPEVDDPLDMEVKLRIKAIPIDPRIVPVVFSEKDYEEISPLTLEIHEHGVPL